VLIAHGQALVRAGLCAQMAQHGEWYVCGTATKTQEALALSERTNPRLALIGAAFDGISGAELAQTLRQRLPQLGIVLLGNTSDPTAILRALQAGVAAVVPPDVTWDELHGVMTGVAEGRFLINDQIVTNPELAQAVFAHVRRGGQDTGLFSPLNAREREILDLIARGQNTKAMANQLALSERTVKEYVGDILRKLGVQDRLQAVMKAIKHGWITIGDEGRS